MMMPMDGTPRVEIIERRGEDPIAGSNSISAALFIGPTPAGPGLYVKALPTDTPQRPVPITSWDDYVRTFGAPKPGAPPAPHLSDYFMSHAVRGFFGNGGSKAYILRLDTGAPQSWLLKNAADDSLFLVRTKPLAGSTSTLKCVAQAGFNLAFRTPALKAKSVDVGARTIKLDAAPVDIFPGDRILFNGKEATVVAVKSGSTNELRLDVGIPAPNSTAPWPFHLAPLTPSPGELRIPIDTEKAGAVDNLARGALVRLAWGGKELWSLVSRLDPVEHAVYLVADHQPSAPIDLTQAGPKLEVRDFKLTLEADGKTAVLDHLSPLPSSTNYIRKKVDAAFGSGTNQVPEPFTVEPLPLPAKLDAWVPTNPVAQNGAPDKPDDLTAAHYRDALDTLKDFDEAKLLVAPDAASHTDRAIIQRALRDHCDAMGDRFALLDAEAGLHASDRLVAQVAQLRSEKGLAAFYYPWIEVPNPSPAGGTLFVPPSGHIAGMFARIDRDRGVFKTPANETLAGALDVQKRLGDDNQGPLHDEGVNVLRVFRGNGSVNVFGGRTTAPKGRTDFRYIGVRRLFLFVEDALERALREKLYEPNDQRLWKSLHRNITEFLGRIQASGGIFGAKPDDGFRVQIDEGNNPASQQKLGILNIRIWIRPTYPAEYIVVEISVWDGNVTITET